RAIFDVLQPSANSPVTVYVGAGTGATTAGFVCEAPEHTQVIGVPAGRFGQWLQDAMTDAIASQGERIVCEWRLEDRHDPGAFGRMTDSLRDFISDFDREYGIRL